MRFAVISPLALGIGLMHVKHKAFARTRGRPLQHLQIAVGVAESRYRPATDMPVDTDRLALLVIDEIDFRQTHQGGLAIRLDDKLRLAAAEQYSLGKKTGRAFSCNDPFVLRQDALGINWLQAC